MIPVTLVSVRAAKVVGIVPSKLIVRTSPTTAVAMFVPPVTVRLSVVVFAVVLPVSPENVANRF